MQLFDHVSYRCSKIITNKYSTSFSLGIKLLGKELHFPIYGIYGFVRYADEIVDTFLEHDRACLLQRFKEDTYRAIEEKISLNPVLHSFQLVVNEYKIDHKLIDAFLQSMEMDLFYTDHKKHTYEEYIYGSAEVVGLMCLKVFCGKDEQKYQSLVEPAKRLGAAFQKVNFLRDIQSDFVDRGRVYFPGIKLERFCPIAKEQIEESIEQDFALAYDGIVRLPKEAKLGVYVAYAYYLQLFKKIKALPPSEVLNARIRVSDQLKVYLLIRSYFKHKLDVL